jgi:hypothetical protein
MDQDEGIDEYNPIAGVVDDYPQKSESQEKPEYVSAGR